MSFVGHIHSIFVSLVASFAPSLRSIGRKWWYSDHKCTLCPTKVTWLSCLSDGKSSPEKFRALTWFEPMASALALQCSTNWAVRETHDIGGRAICWFYRNLWKKVNIEWRWWELYLLFLCSFSCLRRITSSGMTRFVWILSTATQTLRWNYTLVMVLEETRSGNTKRQAAKYYKLS